MNEKRKWIKENGESRNYSGELRYGTLSCFITSNTRETTTSSLSSHTSLSFFSLAFPDAVAHFSTSFSLFVAVKTSRLVKARLFSHFERDYSHGLDPSMTQRTYSGFLLT